jgi:hypothetical protein
LRSLDEPHGAVHGVRGQAYHAYIALKQTAGIRLWSLLAKRRSGTRAMKQIRAYALESEADLARIALGGADIPAVVVGVGIGMKGGVLFVPEDHVDAALKVLKDLEEPR